MNQAKVQEIKERVTDFIETLKEKNDTVKTLTPDDAEVLLTYVGCVESCLNSFIFCSRQDAALAAERGAV